MKRFLIIAAMILTSVSVQAREDCIISNSEKLTDIKIEHNDIIDVFPLITIMNEKNTLIVLDFFHNYQYSEKHFFERTELYKKFYGLEFGKDYKIKEVIV